MIAALREWLLSVAACAALVSLLRQLAPEGAGREAVRFAGGLALMLCMLRPLAGLTLPEEAEVFADAPALEQNYRAAYDLALCESISARTQAYIEDTARGMGLAVRAEVTLTRGDDGTPLPASAVLRGEYSGALERALGEALGIGICWEEDG